MDPTVLREKIKSKLKEQRITVAEAERMSGIGPSSLRNFLLGRIKSPTLETLTALSTTLKWELSELLEAKENSIAPPYPTAVWEPDVFLNTTKYVKNVVEGGKVTLKNEDAIEAIKEIYYFSCTKKGKKVDKEFADWHLRSVLKITPHNS
jgi:transcriptional regulator with XRE-family HTH domain